MISGPDFLEMQKEGITFAILVKKIMVDSIPPNLF